MKTFDVKHILIPVDFSETALLAVDHGTHMAKLFGAELFLVHVNEALIYSTAVSDTYPQPGSNAGTDSAHQLKLNQLSDSIFQKTGIKCKTRIVEGNVADAIVEYAKQISSDVILMGTHGISGIKEFFMGSNAFSVVSEAPCAVITIQSHSRNLGFKNIILPIDDSLLSRQKVNLAVVMAQKYGSTIHITGIVSDDDQIALGKFEVKVEQVRNFLNENGIAYTTEMHPIGDNIAETVLNCVEQKQADLIIVMSEQDPDLTGIFSESFAKQLVNHSKTPIMAVPPDMNLEQGYTFPYWT
jgi:nucleotide-binding universal stress UspA family protein